MKNTKRTASSRKYNCIKGFKQEAPLKVSLISGAESGWSILDLDEGESIKAEALQIKFKIVGSGFKSKSQPGMHGEN